MDTQGNSISSPKILLRTEEPSNMNPECSDGANPPAISFGKTVSEDHSVVNILGLMRRYNSDPDLRDSFKRQKICLKDSGLATKFHHPNTTFLKNEDKLCRSVPGCLNDMINPACDGIIILKNNKIDHCDMDSTWMKVNLGLFITLFPLVDASVKLDRSKMPVESDNEGEMRCVVSTLTPPQDAKFCMNDLIEAIESSCLMRRSNGTELVEKKLLHMDESGIYGLLFALNYLCHGEPVADCREVQQLSLKYLEKAIVQDFYQKCFRSDINKDSTGLFYICLDDDLDEETICSISRYQEEASELLKEMIKHQGINNPLVISIKQIYFRLFVMFLGDSDLTFKVVEKIEVNEKIEVYEDLPPFLKSEMPGFSADEDRLFGTFVYDSYNKNLPQVLLDPDYITFNAVGRGGDGNELVQGRYAHPLKAGYVIERVVGAKAGVT